MNRKFSRPDVKTVVRGMMKVEIIRGEGQGVVLGKDVLVTVLEVGTDWVRLGIHSPNTVPTYREAKVALVRETSHEDFENEPELLSMYR